MKIITDIFSSREAVALYSIIFDEPGLISSKIAEKIGRKPPDVSRGLSNLRKSGLVQMKVIEIDGKLAKSYYPSLTGLLENIFGAKFTAEERKEVESILFEPQIRKVVSADSRHDEGNVFQFMLRVTQVLGTLVDLSKKDPKLEKRLEKVVRILNKHGL